MLVVTVSNLIGSPASGEKQLQTSRHKNKQRFQSNRFSSEWRVILLGTFVLVRLSLFPI